MSDQPIVEVLEVEEVVETVSETVEVGDIQSPDVVEVLGGVEVRNLPHIEVVETGPQGARGEPGEAGATEYAVDSATAAGETGPLALGYSNEALEDLVGPNDRHAPFATDRKGRIIVHALQQLPILATATDALLVAIRDILAGDTEGLGPKLDLIAQYLDQVEPKLEDLKALLDGVEGTLVSIDGSLTAIEVESQEIADNTDNLDVLLSTRANDATVAAVRDRIPDESGPWGGRAGVTGTASIPAGARVTGIAAAADVAGATVTVPGVDGDVVIPVPFKSGILSAVDVAPRGNVSGPIDIVFSGTLTYLVEFVS